MPESAYDTASGNFGVAQMQYAADLSAAGGYDSQNATNIASIKDNILAQKMNAFQQVATDLGRTNDLVNNLKLYKTRTEDATLLAQAMNGTQALDQLTNDKNVTQRQFEINEWYNYKKQETAGTLMGVAIALGLLLLSLIGMKLAIVSPSAHYTTSVILIGFILVWVYWRVSYSGVGRDPVLWHRRRFDTPRANSVIPTTCIGGELEIKENKCLTAVEGKLQGYLDNLSKGMQEFQETGGRNVPALCS
jgi:hypothetical protein